MPMTTHARYTRLEALPAVGAAGLSTLRHSQVAVLGVGNIGGQLARHLVLIGVNVILVDRDVVDATNLGTQGFSESQIGRPKSEACAAWLGPLNPTCRIEPVHADIRRLGLGALREAALLFSCFDNRPSRIVLNEVSVRLGIPWVDGALDGSGRALVGRVACYDPRQPESACYLCPHDATSLQRMSTESDVSAGCSALWWAPTDDLPRPTLAVSALGGVVASLQALWGLKALLGQAAAVAGMEAYFDLGRHVLSTHRLKRNPRCLLDHRTWRLTPLNSDASRLSVADTFAIAEAVLGEGVALHVGQRPIVTRTRCPRCGAEAQPYRVVDRVSAVRCACGSDVRLDASSLIHRFGRPEAAPFLERTWAEIGLPAADVVVATAGPSELHMLLSESGR